MKHQLSALLTTYLSEQGSFESLQTAVQALTGRTLSPAFVDAYLEAYELDDLVSALLDPSIEDWEQFETEKKVTIAIENYEEGHLNLEATQALILAATGSDVSQYSLDNYWRSEDLEEFVQTLCIKAIEDWASIDDARALALLHEILEHPSSAIVLRNGRALEQRYSKPEGTVSDLVFWNDLRPVEMLQRLKATDVDDS